MAGKRPRGPRAPAIPVPKPPEHPEVDDELVRYYTRQADETSLVYAQALVQLINKVYREHDFLQRHALQRQQRKSKKLPSQAYDTAVLYDQRSLAWVIRAAQLYVPQELQHQPITQPDAIATDTREAELAPHVDVLFHVQNPDQVLAYYFSMARAAGVVYALALPTCIRALYRMHGQLRRREVRGQTTEWDTIAHKDLVALAWLLRLVAAHIPETVKRHVVPPLPPRPDRSQPQTKRAQKAKDQADRLKDILYHPQPPR